MAPLIQEDLRSQASELSSEHPEKLSRVISSPLHTAGRDEGLPFFLPAWHPRS